MAGWAGPTAGGMVGAGAGIVATDPVFSGGGGAGTSGAGRENAEEGKSDLESIAEIVLGAATIAVAVSGDNAGGGLVLPPLKVEVDLAAAGSGSTLLWIAGGIAAVIGVVILVVVLK